MAEIVSARQNPQDILDDTELFEGSQSLFIIDIQMPEYDTFTPKLLFIN